MVYRWFPFALLKEMFTSGYTIYSFMNRYWRRNRLRPRIPRPLGLSLECGIPDNEEEVVSG
jgi:hypothetical protein